MIWRRLHGEQKMEDMLQRLYIICILCRIELWEEPAGISRGDATIWLDLIIVQLCHCLHRHVIINTVLQTIRIICHVACGMWENPQEDHKYPTCLENNKNHHGTVSNVIG